MAQSPASLAEEAEQLIELSENILKAAPSVDMGEIEAEKERDLTEEIEMVGDPGVAEKAFENLDNGNYQKVEHLLKGHHLSPEEYEEFIKRYIGAKIMEALRLFEWEEGKFKILGKNLKDARDSNERFDHVDKEDMAFRVGGPLMKLDNQKLLKAQKRATQAENCMQHYGIRTTGEVKNPVEIVEDIRELDRDIEAMQEQIESILGMSRKDILQTYAKKRKENPYLN